MSQSHHGAKTVAAGLIKLRDALAPWQEAATTLVSGQVRTTGYEPNAEESAEAWALIDPLDAIALNDPVALVQLGGKPLTLGKIVRGAVGLATIKRNVRIEGELTVTGGIAGSNPIFQENVATNALTLSTTNTVTPVDALNRDIELGPGTWSILVVGSVECINSASGQAVGRVTCDGVAGVEKTSPALSSSIYGTVKASAIFSNVSGGRLVTCLVQYRCAAASTTTARHPQLVIIARRTA